MEFKYQDLVLTSKGYMKWQGLIRDDNPHAPDMSKLFIENVVALTHHGLQYKLPSPVILQGRFWSHGDIDGFWLETETATFHGLKDRWPVGLTSELF